MSHFLTQMGQRKSLLSSNTQNVPLNDEQLESKIKNVLKQNRSALTFANGVIEIIWSYYNPKGTRLLHCKSFNNCSEFLECYDLITGKIISSIPLPRSIKIDKVYLLFWKNKPVIVISEFEVGTVSGDKPRGLLYITETNKWMNIPSSYSISNPKIIENKLYRSVGGSGGPWCYYWDMLGEHKWKSADKYYENRQLTFRNVCFEYDFDRVDESYDVVYIKSGEHSSSKMSFKSYSTIVMDENRGRFYIFSFSFDYCCYFQIDSDFNFDDSSSKDSKNSKEFGHWFILPTPNVDYQQYANHKVLPYLDGIIIIGNDSDMQSWSPGQTKWNTIHVSDISVNAVIY